MIKAVAERAYNRIAGGVGIFGLAVVMSIAARIYIPAKIEGIALISLAVVALFAPLILIVASAWIFVRGCWFYSIAKGHAGILGVVGLMPFLGWIVLILLPDNHKHDDIEGFPVVQEN